MPHRHEAWWAQAHRDYEAAQHSFDAGSYEWCAYQSQQAAEKALKALLRFHGREMRGHVLPGLLETIRSFLAVPSDVWVAAQELDQHYFRSRYPDSLASGHPAEAYDGALGAECLRYAESILEFVEQNIS